jgi:tRNA threonylcarbamoyl adenosine modification protein YeaZ
MTNERDWLLAIDTATSVVVVAAGSTEGQLRAFRSFPAEHRHGSHLLPTIDALLRDEGLSLDRIAGVVVGLGPGAFTGLRVGLATAKTLAHARGLPIVGISTGEALLAGVPGANDLLLPAGPHDRVRVRRGLTPALESGDAAENAAGDPGTIAVDLSGRAPDNELERGRMALAALPASLLRLGAERLAAVGTDDVERLVPEYVSLPRGVTTEVGEGGVAWSRDPR